MISRCHNANDKGYARYGARGIKVCDEWRDDFDIFESWALKAGYTEGLTIDRVNNDGNYEPSNCEFISRGRNASKTSRNVILSAFGENKITYDWLRDPRCKVKIHLLRARLDKLKWRPEDAISIPPNKLFTGRSKTALQSQILQGV